MSNSPYTFKGLTNIMCAEIAFENLCVAEFLFIAEKFKYWANVVF